MSSAWVEAAEAESFEGYGGDEAEDVFEGIYGDGEAFDESDDAESRYSRRRNRARRLARARRRRRAALARARSASPAAGPPTTAAVVRRTEADVAKLEVESSVQADAVSSMLAAHRQQLRASATAAAASAVVPSLLSFLETSAPDVGTNRYFRAGLPLAPLLLLRSSDRGLSDRRLWAVAAVAGLVVAGDLKSKSQDVTRLNLNKSIGDLPVGAPVPFGAQALDRDGNPTVLPPGASIVWESSKPGKVKVDAQGIVTVKTSATVGEVATIFAILKAQDGTELKRDWVTIRVV